jgi:hypothetical protein
MSHIRIFPHSQKEFPSRDFLMTWLLTSLRGLGGVYHLRTAAAVDELPAGSVVLFRHGHEVIGEAVVLKGKEVFAEPVKGRTLSSEEVSYEARVTFAPSSVRLYAPPLPVDLLQPLTGKDLKQYAGSYTKLNWDVYPRILEAVVAGGGFVS